MAYPGHNASDVKSLDAARHRIQQLTNALTSLRRDIEISDPLPPWSTLLTTSHLLTHHVSALTSYFSTTFNTHSDSTISNFSLGGQPHAYPLPTFPFGPDKENILGQLLRKKLDPEVEEWIEGADRVAQTALKTDDVSRGSTNGMTTIASLLSADEQEELWSFANPRAHEIAAGIPWVIDYTIAERDAGVDSVVTGLKRKLDDGMETDDDEDEDDDNDNHEDGDHGEDADEKMTGAGEYQGKRQIDTSPQTIERPMTPLDEVLRFMMTGAIPRMGSSLLAGARPGVAPR